MALYLQLPSRAYQCVIQTDQNSHLNALSPDYRLFNAAATKAFTERIQVCRDVRHDPCIRAL